MVDSNDLKSSVQGFDKYILLRWRVAKWQAVWFFKHKETKETKICTKKKIFKANKVIATQMLSGYLNNSVKTSVFSVRKTPPHEKPYKKPRATSCQTSSNLVGKILSNFVGKPPHENNTKSPCTSLYAKCKGSSLQKPTNLHLSR